MVDVKSVINRYGVSINDIAQQMGMSRQSVHYFIKQGDKNSVDNLIKLSKAIGCDLLELLDYSSDMGSDKALNAVITYEGKVYSANTLSEVRKILQMIDKGA